MFKVLKTDGAARRGEFSCPHGTVQTPVFMNVGTQARHQGRAVGRRSGDRSARRSSFPTPIICTCVPATRWSRDMGGLHKFMTWDGPILTDSGGFQVFSLAGLRKIKEEGVTFASHLDGHKIFMGPEESMQIQSNLGSDIAMAFDECVENPAPYDYVQGLLRSARPAGWRGARQRADPAATLQPDAVNPGQMLWGINQGGDLCTDLRIEHMKRDRRAGPAGLCHRRPGRRRADGGHVRDHRGRRALYAEGQAALSHGRRHAVEYHRRRGPGRGLLRLRHARPQRAARASCSPGRGVINLKNAKYTPRRRPHRPAVRLPGLPALFPGLSAPPVQGGRDAGHAALRSCTTCTSTIR